ncbi:MAG: hypothetical protein Q8J74_08110 [Candidatus Didemnitutus sp.]|nr:hypothetical protein [Candidatus Didemnitutus sp.]
MNCDPSRALRFLAANYRDVADVSWATLQSEYLRLRKRSASQQRHLAYTLTDFGKSLSADKAAAVSLVTEADAMDFLDRWKDAAPKTWNERFFHLGAAFKHAVKKGYCVRSPLAAVEHKVVEHPDPIALTPAQAAALMAHVESQHPEFAGYFALCIFAGLRPDVREGEARRLHEDIVAGRGVVGVDAIRVQGKGRRGLHSKRTLRLNDCGPLRAWLSAYPITRGLWPQQLSPTQADRRIAEIRQLFSLSHDVLRHTAATAMVHAPGASYAVAANVLGNSETMLRKHYCDLVSWSAADTRVFWSIQPKRLPFSQTGTETGHLMPEQSQKIPTRLQLPRVELPHAS